VNRDHCKELSEHKYAEGQATKNDIHFILGVGDADRLIDPVPNQRGAA